MSVFPPDRHDRSGYAPDSRFGSGGGKSGDRTVRICPPHLRGKEVGRSYHDVESRQVRDYDQTEGVAALLRRHFGFDRIEAMAREPNALLEALQFEPAKEAVLRYVPETKFGAFPSAHGTVSGRYSHLVPNFEAVPRVSQPPKSSQPQRSANMVVRAIKRGVEFEFAKDLGELAALHAHLSGEDLTTNTMDRFINMPKDSAREVLEIYRKRKAVQQEERDTCSAAPPGQPVPKIKISIYLDDGNVFEYEVADVTSARDHVSKIVKTGYRHSAASATDELVHYPPHRIDKVKMKGPGISTNYYDRPRGT